MDKAHVLAMLVMSFEREVILGFPGFVQAPPQCKEACDDLVEVGLAEERNHDGWYRPTSEGIDVIKPALQRAQ